MAESNTQRANVRMLAKVMFRLLPIQILLAAVGAVNGMLSSYFASNYIGVDAMSAVGLYGPVSQLLLTVSTMLMGGSVILCGKYMGRNEQEKLQNVFSLNMVVSALTAAAFALLFLVLGGLDRTGVFTRDRIVRPLFNRFLLGQAIGVLPMLLGSQLSAFLSVENRGRLTTLASLIYIAVNIGLNFLFVKVLRLGTFGLALAMSLGMWVFFAVQAWYFLSGRSHMKVKLGGLQWGETGEILRVGVPGALIFGYQTARGLFVNWLIEAFVGTLGISAFAAANNLLAIFWAIPGGMLAVSRMMIGVSIGEEDRRSLTDVMRVMFRCFVPLMTAVSLLLIAGAVPLTRIFFRSPAEPVFRMALRGLRLLPLCMPLSVVCMHFICYGQSAGKQGLVHVLSLLDGVLSVTVFSALLIRSLGLDGVYIANILNGVVSLLVIVAYAWLRKKGCPRNMEELMAIPADFGAPETERMDLSVGSMKEVLSISREVQRFCRDKGIDERRAYLAGLALEEMAGNIVEHGFKKDRKRHSVDVRVVHKGEDVILRLKDDCVPFDPGERQAMAAGGDPTRNIGIRMVFQTARDLQYHNILGMNVLTIRF